MYIYTGYSSNGVYFYHQITLVSGGLGLVFPKTKLSRGRIGSTPCRVGWGLGRGLGLDAFKKSSGSGWVDSVSSWVGSGRGLGRVGDGSGPC